MRNTFSSIGGMALGETTRINIEEGKTLVIKYLGLGDLNSDGTRNVQFELNGMRREVAVPDKNAVATVKQAVLADPEDKSQIGASIPGAVTKVEIKPGDKVVANQVIAVVEAMKMETSVVARLDGTVDEVFVKPGQTVVAGELLANYKIRIFKVLKDRIRRLRSFLFALTTIYMYKYCVSHNRA